MAGLDPAIHTVGLSDADPPSARKLSITPPIAWGIAVLVAASLMPGTMLPDAILPAGDGTSGFGNTLLFLLVALIVTVTGVVIGLRRKERYRWLGYVALALWVLPVVVV